MENEYYSNCLLEAIKAKMKGGKQIKIMLIKSKDGLFHWIWYDLSDGNIYDFQQLYMVKHWYNLFWFKGKIRVRSFEAYERWKTV